jgi:hypothetical protein
MHLVLLAIMRQIIITKLDMGFGNAIFAGENVMLLNDKSKNLFDLFG